MVGVTQIVRLPLLFVKISKPSWDFGATSAIHYIWPNARRAASPRRLLYR
jgi:hypothetical protein